MKKFEMNLELPDKGGNDFDYVLSEECEVEGKVLFEKLWEESKNTIYPWDWMVNKEVKKDDRLLDELTTLTLTENENKRKVDDDLEIINQTPPATESKKSCSLSQDHLDQVNKIKANLDQNGNEEIFRHLVRFLSQLSLAQIEMACDQLELSRITEQILINFTHYLIEAPELLSVNLIITLFRSLFYSKIKALNQAPAQLFTSSLIKLSQKYPRPSFEGLCVSLIHGSANLSEFEIDFLIRILRESFPEEIQIQFFQHLLNQNKPWTEPDLKLIQSLTDLKVPMNSNIMNSLIIHLHKLRVDFATNLKFARLVQSIVKNHLTLVRENNLIEKLESVVTSNQSIIRKSLSNLLLSR